MFIRILSGSLSLIRRPNNVPYLSVFTSSELEFRIQDSVWSNSFRKPFMSLSFLTLANVTNLFKKELINTCVCVCVCVRVCVFIFFHREGFFRLQDIQDMLERYGSTILCCEYSSGCFCQVPSSLFPNLSYFTSKDVTPARRKNWRENDMIYCAPAKR